MRIGIVSASFFGFFDAPPARRAVLRRIRKSAATGAPSRS